MIDSALTMEAYLADVTNEINCQVDVGKLFPDAIMSLANTVDQIREFIDVGEYELAYEYIIGLIDWLPFELSASSSLKFIDVGLTFGYKTESDFDAIFDRRSLPNSGGENDYDSNCKWGIVERNLLSVWCEIGKQIVKGTKTKGYSIDSFCSDGAIFCDYQKKIDNLGYGYLLITDIIHKHLVKISGMTTVRLIEAALLLGLRYDFPISENQLR